MTDRTPNDVDHLAADDEDLLRDCQVDTYKASGPGGQHRNKTSSAVRLTHKPTGISAHGDDSRSQHENKRLALKRLRMNLALQLRHPLPKSPGGEPPAFVKEALHRPKKGNTSRYRLDMGRKDQRFWRVSAFMLDALEHHNGQLRAAADTLGISTSNFVAHAKKDRHLLGAMQTIRRQHELSPIK